jgi:hypothetical protein
MKFGRGVMPLEVKEVRQSKTRSVQKMMTVTAVLSVTCDVRRNTLCDAVSQVNGLKQWKQFVTLHCALTLIVSLFIYKSEVFVIVERSGFCFPSGEWTKWAEEHLHKYLNNFFYGHKIENI